jgi:hypothetical protein
MEDTLEGIPKRPPWAYAVGIGLPSQPARDANISIEEGLIVEVT